MPDRSETSDFEVTLTGCRPEPLASYLKALGTFRAVAEQRDREARGFWRGEHFVLRSSLDRTALARFLLSQWRPSPVIAPWNGGSGFYPKDNKAASDAITTSSDPRLEVFRASINVARAFIAERGWNERPADEEKLLTISQMRASLPEEALAWLDAAVVLGSDRLLFPPLLGTGGNDGRLDFSNNFQQRVLEVLCSPASAPLESSLFGDVVTNRFKGTMGQYMPAASERTNPWDFVLLIEGALMFAAAATRRYETSSSAVLAFPFHARAAGGVSSLADGDEAESRDELWLPLWTKPASLREIGRLFAEGRATVGSGERARPAATALEFARAITSLGVDRGIDAFSRVGFHVRNGLAYFATPLGRLGCGDVRATRLLDDLDEWFDRFRQRASGKGVPARVRLAKRRLEQAMFDAVGTGKLGPVLLEVAAAEQALARSLAFAKKSFLGPVRPVQSAWADAVADGSVEQRLAAALASRPGIRGRMVPLDRSGRGFGSADDAGLVFAERPLVDNLHALLQREDMEVREARSPLAGVPVTPRCSLTDLAQFIAADTDDALIERWLRAFVLLDGGARSVVATDSILPPASFALLALVHHRRMGDVELPRTAGVLTSACGGDAIGATHAAIRRLAASRVIPVPALVEPVARMRRIAAALAFPLTKAQRRTLEGMVLPALQPESDVRSGTAQEQT